MHNLIAMIIEFLNSTALSTYLMSSAWLWPILEMIHFLGLSLLFGSLLLVDLRVIGFAPNVPLEKVEVFVRFAIIGFALNLLTGTMFVIGDSDRYLVNIAFWAKMILIGLAGMNTAYFVRRVQPLVRSDFGQHELPIDAKIVASASLVLWTLIIILGRMIPYVEE